MLFVTGAVVADSGVGPKPVGHVARQAPGRVEPGVFRGPGDGQPDHHVGGDHEPAAAHVVGHQQRVIAARDRTAVAAGSHRRHRDSRVQGVRQGRQRVRGKFQRQRVQHGRPKDAGVQPA